MEVQTTRRAHMKSIIFILVFLVLNLYFSIAQKAVKNNLFTKDSITYEAANNTYFEKYANTNLFIKYYFSDNKSWGDKYTYEIILTDSLLTLKFYSTMSDSYFYTNYEKRQILNKFVLDSIKDAIITSNITQKIRGFPVIQNSAHISEN